MKVQILNLDSHDDRSSILDRLGWVQAPRALLVWPAEGLSGLKTLDLVLLQRRALRQATSLGIVASDPDILQMARALGIPVFDSPEHQPERAWRRASRRPPSWASRRPLGPNHAPQDRPRPRAAPGQRTTPRPAIRAGLFALSLLAALATLAYAAPSAEVELVPATTVQETTLELSLAPGGRGSPAGSIPGVWRATRVHGELRIPTTGSTTMASTAATGLVIFTNLTDDTVPIPLGTGLRAGDIRFTTTASAQLPAQRGSQVRVAIQASRPGESGNVGTGDISAIEGPIGLMVAATNPEPTAGGAETVSPAVSAADISRAFRTLESQLFDQAEATTRSTLESGEVLATRSRQISAEFQRSHDPEIGARADSLHIVLDVEVAFLVYLSSDLEAGVAAAMAELDADVQPVPGSLVLQVEEIPSLDDSGGLRLRTAARRRIFPVVDLRQLAARITGQPPAAASRTLMAALDLDRPPTIAIRPRLMPVLPWLSPRIEVHWPWESGA